METDGTKALVNRGHAPLHGAQTSRTFTLIDAPNLGTETTMVDVGGFRLCLSCSGEGEPLVVLISGSGAIAATWELVQSGISRFARVCAYDRAGFGASDLGPILSTISDRAEQLCLLLENAGLKSPFVLVGMSYGGLIRRAFQYHYTEKVCGMVWKRASSIEH